MKILSILFMCSCLFVIGCAGKTRVVTVPTDRVVVEQPRDLCSEPESFTLYETTSIGMDAALEKSQAEDRYYQLIDRGFQVCYNDYDRIGKRHITKFGVPDKYKNRLLNKAEWFFDLRGATPERIEMILCTAKGTSYKPSWRQAHASHPDMCPEFDEATKSWK